ncbi:MAG: ATP-binding cassette domain-containing protein [Bacteroidota bacterium]|nr:ATP-binding cassette domain-containing protein [Bacteroidota bacterium]
MNTCIFIAKNVTKQYGNYIALNNINIKIPQGSIFGLLGPNGAGKTTLMRIINQITAPDSGELYFNGEILNRSHIPLIGYLPEERGLYKKMKVGEQALYLAQLKGMSYKDAIQKLKFWFEKLNIMDWWHKKVEELSKGMAQKIQFIVTIIHQPELLIFDEPFSGFDPINAAIIRDEILELSKQGTSIIFSTHRMESVEEICTDIALIHNAKTILDGPISSIKQKFTDQTYEITLLQGELVKNNLFEIINREENTFIIEPNNGNSIQVILESINKEFNIISFKKRLPSMEDIFIKAVNHE